MSSGPSRRSRLRPKPQRKSRAETRRHCKVVCRCACRCVCVNCAKLVDMPRATPSTYRAVWLAAATKLPLSLWFPTRSPQLPRRTRPHPCRMQQHRHRHRKQAAKSPRKRCQRRPPQQPPNGEKHMAQQRSTKRVLEIALVLRRSRASGSRQSTAQSRGAHRTCSAYGDMPRFFSRQAGTASWRRFCRTHRYQKPTMATSLLGSSHAC